MIMRRVAVKQYLESFTKDNLITGKGVSITSIEGSFTFRVG